MSNFLASAHAREWIRSTGVRHVSDPRGTIRGSTHAARGSHRIWIQRQDHAFSAHDQRTRDSARCTRQVPDARLDRLTAMYNPRKRVPATVEFTDIAAAGAAGGAKALVDVAAYKNA